MFGSRGIQAITHNTIQEAYERNKNEIEDGILVLGHLSEPVTRIAVDHSGNFRRCRGKCVQYFLNASLRLRSDQIIITTRVYLVGGY